MFSIDRRKFIKGLIPFRSFSKWNRTTPSYIRWNTGSIFYQNGFEVLVKEDYMSSEYIPFFSGCYHLLCRYTLILQGRVGKPTKHLFKKLNISIFLWYILGIFLPCFPVLLVLHSLACFINLTGEKPGTIISEQVYHNVIWIGFVVIQ